MLPDAPPDAPMWWGDAIFFTACVALLLFTATAVALGGTM